MNIRLANKKDSDEIMHIIDDTKKYFKCNGIPQWQQGIPSSDTILCDIEAKASYVLLDDDEIIGTFALFFSEDEAYKDIKNGRWINEYEYAVIHRIAIKSSCKGNEYASLLLKFAEQKALKQHIENIRIDTHQKNESMKRLLSKNNFVYCGVVQVCEIDGERFAYQKIIKKA